MIDVDRLGVGMSCVILYSYHVLVYKNVGDPACTDEKQAQLVLGIVLFCFFPTAMVAMSCWNMILEWMHHDAPLEMLMVFSIAIRQMKR